jgi:DNA replication protein DnaC
MSDPTTDLDTHLAQLKLPYLREHYPDLARQAIAKNLGHLDYLAMLIDGEIRQRADRAVDRRLRQANFPYPKTLDHYQFSHPRKIDRARVQHLFSLDFIRQKANATFLGGCGMGKTHLAIALGRHACIAGHRVLFTTAIDLVNSLGAAQAAGQLDRTLRAYRKPQLLIIDELGYLPIDRHGANLLFQIISTRYETASTLITTNRPFKDWPHIFDHDATLASAVLDRHLHHHDLILIEGDSYRITTPKSP